MKLVNTNELLENFIYLENLQQDKNDSISSMGLVVSTDKVVHATTTGGYVYAIDYETFIKKGKKTFDDSSEAEEFYETLIEYDDVVILPENEKELVCVCADDQELTGLDLYDFEEDYDNTYIQIMFDDKEIILSNYVEKTFEVEKISEYQAEKGSIECDYSIFKKSDNEYIVCVDERSFRHTELEAINIFESKKEAENYIEELRR